MDDAKLREIFGVIAARRDCLLVDEARTVFTVGATNFNMFPVVLIETASDALIESDRIMKII